MAALCRCGAATGEVAAARCASVRAARVVVSGRLVAARPVSRRRRVTRVVSYLRRCASQPTCHLQASTALTLERGGRVSRNAVSPVPVVLSRVSAGAGLLACRPSRAVTVKS